MQLLHQTKVQEVHFLYTEIGEAEYGAFANAFPQGLFDLQQKIEIEKLEQHGI